MKWGIIILLVLVVIIALVLIIGYLLPVKHSVSISADINTPIDSVWQRISQPENFQHWRKDIKSINVLSSEEWVETNSQNDNIPIKIIEALPGRKMVTIINSKQLPYGGSWTYELKPKGVNTEITITENGEVYNPLYRFFSKFVFGHTATIKSYLNNLETSF